MPQFKEGDSVRLKEFNPNVDESDLSPLDPQETNKTDFNARWKKDTVFSVNEAVVLSCSMAIEDTLMYGQETVGIVKGDPYWTHALEAAAQMRRLNSGMRDALAERVPFGESVVVYPCGAVITQPTGEEWKTGCANAECPNCHPTEPRYGILCCQRIDGKMGIEKLAEL